MDVNHGLGRACQVLASKSLSSSDLTQPAQRRGIHGSIGHGQLRSCGGMSDLLSHSQSHLRGW